MNYHNYSLAEMVTVLTNEPDPDRFIEAAKVFVEKYVDVEHFTQDDMDTAKDAEYNKGYNAARIACQDEMVGLINNNYSLKQPGVDIEGLLSDAKVLG